jgi:hypothetical protein
MRGYLPWTLGIGELLALIGLREFFGFGNAMWNDLFMAGVFWTLLCVMAALVLFTARTFRLARSSEEQENDVRTRTSLRS